MYIIYNIVVNYINN